MNVGYFLVKNIRQNLISREENTIKLVRVSVSRGAGKMVICVFNIFFSISKIRKF